MSEQSGKHQLLRSLLSIYAERRLTAGGRGLPLHCSCQFAADCWNDASGRAPDSSDPASHVAAPWIGNGYQHTRILAIGENLNELGGLLAQWRLFRRAIYKMKFLNKRRLFGGGLTADGRLYRGTMFHFRLASYAHALHRAICPLELHRQQALIKEPRWLGEVLDLIAFTNQVKCSPTGTRSKPTDAMWRNCGAHLLLAEIQVLQPQWILLVGKTRNRWFFEESICRNRRVLVYDDRVTAAFTCDVEHLPLRVLAIPHPSYFRISVQTVVDSITRGATALMELP